MIISFENDLMSVVGKNDVGKSTLIKAIETFFSKRTFMSTDFPYGSGEGVASEICLHFDQVSDLSEEFKIDNEAIIKHTYHKNKSTLIKTIECLKKFVPPDKDDLVVYSNLKKIGTSLGVVFPKNKPAKKDEIEELKEEVIEIIDKLEGENLWVTISNSWPEIVQHLPELITVPAAQDPESEQKMTSDSSAFGSLFRVGIRKLLHQDEEGTSAVSLLETKMKSINAEILSIVESKLITQGDSFSISQVTSPLDVSKSFSFQMDIEDEYGIKTPLSQRGNGLQRSVLMAIIRAQSDINRKISGQIDRIITEESESYLYLIEEPEAFLHLSAQRDLYYSIKELINDGSQALITTHSTLFMDEGDLDQVILLSRDGGKTSATQSLEISDVREDIGEIVQISQLMTGKVCCLVEGIADVNALKVWFSTLGYNYRELGIYFIDMKGCQNAEYYANVKVIKDFKVQFLILLDTDFHSTDRVENLSRVLRDEYNVREHQLFVLQKGEIENYFPKDKIESVLHLEENSIESESFNRDPKEAMKVAKDMSGSGARKYKENRDSTKIAKQMNKGEIDEEIIELINNLVRSAGGVVIEV